MLTVLEHIASPAARHSTAAHWAVEWNACLLAGPPGDALFAVESKASSKVSKLVFADCTKAAKKA
jgi:hypothetical protein